MFQVNEGAVAMTGKNDRVEMHGDVEVLACDLNFTWITGNGCLAMFAPELRHSLYKKPEGGTPDLPGIADPEHLTALRFPALAPLKWTGGELLGGELKFHFGVKSVIAIPMVKLHKFKLEPMEGGTVAVGFQVQCRPNEQQSGKLSKFLTDKTCLITITPPPAPDDLTEGADSKP